MTVGPIADRTFAMTQDIKSAGSGKAEPAKAEAGSSERDYVELAAGGVGAAAGATALGYVGMQGGFAAGMLSSLVWEPSSVAGFLMRMGWGACIGGAIGVAAGAVAGAILGKELVSFIKEKMNREEQNPDVRKVFADKDSFQQFKGLKMGGIRFGSFTEKPHTEQTQEKVKTSDVSQNAVDMAKMGAKMMTTDKLKPDLSSISVNPEATSTHIKTDQESFRGLAIGSRFKVGHAHSDKSEIVKNETDFTFKAKLMDIADTKMTLKMQLGTSESKSSQDRDGFI